MHRFSAIGVSMSLFSNRIKISLFGFVTLWIFARTVFAMTAPVSEANQLDPMTRASLAPQSLGIRR
jgi:hypothetical protein